MPDRPLRILSLGTAYGWWGTLKPEILEDETAGQIGGGEQAWLLTAARLAARGHEVHVAGDFAAFSIYRGARFHPAREAIGLALDAGPWDAILAWCEVGGGKHAAGLPFFVGLPLPPETLRLVPQQLNHVFDARDVDCILSPSCTHARRVIAPRFPGPIAIVPNGLDRSRMNQTAAGPRVPHRVVYASSPDRGLHHLLAAWPYVRREVAGAELWIYYEIQRWRDSLDCDLSRKITPDMAYLACLLDQALEAARRAGGVHEIGAVHPRRLARDLLAAGVLCYPCDPPCFTEGFGQVPLEAAAQGLYTILSDADALPEIHSDHASRILPRASIGNAPGLADEIVRGIRIVRDRRGQGWLRDEDRSGLIDRWEWDRAADRIGVLIRAGRAGLHRLPFVRTGLARSREAA